MQQIIITGGAGFIGSNLIKYFIESFEVIIIDNFDKFYSRKIKEKNISEYKNHKNFHLFETDICDQNSLNQIFEKFNNVYCVIHLAAKAGVRPSIEDVNGYMNVNVIGTTNILECCKNHNIKNILCASSSSVYGNRNNSPFFENDQINQPISPYAASKVAGEAICYTYAHLYDMNIYCFRFFTVYGPGQRPDLAIHKFANLIYSGKEIEMYGDGSTQRDYTYIDDICESLYKFATIKKNGYEIINLGNSNPVKLIDLINLIEKNLDIKAKINQKPMQPGDVGLTFADISKANQLIDYDPKTKIEKGIKHFVKWFLESKK